MLREINYVNTHYKPLSSSLQFGNRASLLKGVIPELPAKTAADTFFKLPSIVDNYFTRHWLGPKQPVLKRAIGTPLKTVVEAFSDHDYKDLFSLPGLGRSGMIPPLGAIATIVIPVTLLGRLYCSYKRSSNMDKREIGDVLRRDLPTLVILVYMLGPIVKSMTHMLQNTWGLQLMSHLKDLPKASSSPFTKLEDAIKSSAKPLGYTQLDRYYTLNSPHRLAAILNTPFNHNGVLRALHHFQKATPLDTSQKKLLQTLRTSIKTAMRQGQHGKLHANSPLIQHVFKQLAAFDKLAVETSMKRPPAIRSFISQYAKGARHISSFTGLAIIVGLLGFGVTKFNEWWAHFQYGRLYRKQDEHMRGQIAAE